MKTDELGPKILVAVKTPEGRAAIKTFAEMCNEVWQEAEACSKTFDWGVIPPEILIKLRTAGLEKQLEIVMSVPENLRQVATAGDCRLFWMLRTLLTEAEPFDKLQDDIALIQLGRRCNEEIVRRELENPIGLRLLELKAQEDFGIAPFEIDESGKVETHVLEKLLDDLRPVTKRFRLPHEVQSHQNDARDEVLQEMIIAKTFEKLRTCKWEDVFVQVISGEFESLKGKIASNKMTDELRTQTKKSEIPRSKIQSIDEEVRTTNGSQALALDFLTAKNEALQTQSALLEFEFNDYQKNALKEYLNEKELKILEVIFSNPDDTQEDIAQKTGYSQGEVSKTKSQFKKFEFQIRKISGLPEKK